MAVVNSEEILDILEKYSVIACEVTNHDLCVSVQDDPEIIALFDKIDADRFDSNDIGLDISFTPTDNPTVYPCDITITLWWIAFDNGTCYEEPLFTLCDGTVTVNNFDTDFEVDFNK